MKEDKVALRGSLLRKLNGFGLLLVFSILLAACGGGEPAPPIQPPEVTEQIVEAAPTEIPPTPVPTVDVEQVYAELWLLVGFGDATSPTVVERDTVITLAFSPDGTVSGSSGCNNYSSTYDLMPDGTLTITSPFAVTMMNCPRGMEQEAAYLAALETAHRLAINEEGRLELLFDSGQPYEEILIYVPGETSLVGTQWVLLAFGDADSPATVETGTTITAIYARGALGPNDFFR